MATFLGFPAASNLLYIVLKTGLHWMADIIAMYIIVGLLRCLSQLDSLIELTIKIMQSVLYYSLIQLMATKARLKNED